MSSFLVSFATLTLTAFEISAASNEGCFFDTSQYPAAAYHRPLMLTTDFKIIHPIEHDDHSKRVITLNMNQVFYIACLGTEMNALKLTGRQLNRAKCAGNDKIRIDGRDDDMIFFRSSLGCTASNKETIRNNGPCANGLGTLNQVGYSTGEHFIWLYEACFDRANYSALYSKNEIAGQWIGGRFELPRSRTLSSRGVNFPLSNLKLSQAYKPDEQIKTFAKTLRRLVLAHIYVGEVFLSPVLLSASGDFIDASSQSATFYHFNAAPQWETIKSGNWRKLEMAVRQEARGHCDLIVYTGTWGVLHLTDNNNESQPIYLAYDKENNGLLPVPKYFWKVVHNPVDNTALALITINNPHMTLVKKEDIFCPDVCNQVLWIYWDVSNIRNGYTFCCAVRDFSRVVLYSPQLNVPLFGGVPFSLVMEPSFNYLADLLANLMASAVAMFAILFPIYSCLAGFSLL